MSLATAAMVDCLELGRVDVPALSVLWCEKALRQSFYAQEVAGSRENLLLHQKVQYRTTESKFDVFHLGRLL